MSAKTRFTALEYGLILLTFTICLIGAFRIPVQKCPDERARRLLSNWIYSTGTLPTGNEWQTIIMHWEGAPSPDGADTSGYDCANWGFSYALRPYLTAILSAFFMRVSAVFTDSPDVRLAFSRLGSVLSLTVCCFYCLRLGHRLFVKRSSAVLLAAIVCFLPQVMFLGMYQNNDIFSLCAVSITLYYFVEGYDLKWPVSSCAGLAIGFSLGALSYYSVYGWLLMCAVFCVIAVLTDPEIPDKGRLILKRAALVLGVCFFLAGWFFIRNAILHDGDFLGLTSENLSRAHFQEQGYDLHSFMRYRDEGLSLAQFLTFRNFEWLRMSTQSFVGVFDYMTIYLPQVRYGVYYAVFGFGVLFYLAVIIRRKPNKRDRLLIFVMLLSCGITLLLSFLQSYIRDYQPQGRYIITFALLFGYMISYGMDKSTLLVSDKDEEGAIRLHPAAVLSVIYILMFLRTMSDTMIKMIQ